MYLAPHNRIQLLESQPIKFKSTGAEIGVAEGLFSQLILHHLKPRKLHLIDPWIEQKDNDYVEDINNVSQDQNNDRFYSVSKIFQEELRNGRVEIHRAYSQDMYEKFEDEYFDWIYIDGLHTYEGVRDDLNGFDKKVKAGGLIMGHDYCKHELGEAMKFGVVEAVNEFVDQKGYEIVFLTHEAYPTYVIAKDMQSEFAQYFLNTIQARMNCMVWIDQPTKKTLKQDIRQLMNPEGKLLQIKNLMYFMDSSS